MPVDDDDRTLLPPGGQVPAMAPAPSDRPQAIPIGAVTGSDAFADPLRPGAAEDGVSLPVGYRLHEFEVQAKLGQGGFCIVYKAFDHQLKRVVALKEYMPNGMARRAGNSEVLPQSPRSQEVFDIGLNSFVKEGITLARFDHPALVRVHRTFQANGTAYMVMQLVQGTTLEHAARAMATPPDEAWLLRLLDPLTAALQVVHDERIVHRDIAPDNVMILDGDRRPLLLDFGAARQVIGDTEQAPTAMLKPSYAPVEQYPDSGQPQGAWTDVYALAGVVHRLATGKAPPSSQSRALKESYVPLAERLAGQYSARFLKAVDHALALRPEERTQSIADFRQELGLDDPDRGATPNASAARVASKSATGSSGSSKSAQVKRPSVMLAGAAGAVALVAAAVVAFRLGSSPPPQEAATLLPAPTPAPIAVAVPSTVMQAPQPASASLPAPHAAGLPLDPSTEFDRILQRRSPEFQVALKVAKPSIRMHRDPLQLQLESTQAGYFYVLIHDTDKEVRMLFPNASALDNRIAPGQVVPLPRPPYDLVFGEPTGPARLLAIVSARPLDYATATKIQDSGYRLLFQGAEANAISPSSDRPLYLGKLVCDSPSGNCPDGYGAATAEIKVTP